MKKIGLLGGTSWPSTVIYYKRLNELILQELGPFHSCPMIMLSIDYHPIKSRYANGWPEIPGLLREKLEELLSFGPDCVLICNNTLHRALDRIEEDLDLQVPLFHIIRLTRAHLLRNAWKNVLLLGTKFTMEDDYFAGPLRKAGINVITPGLAEREKIQEIQTQLSKGIMQKAFAAYFQEIADNYTAAEAIVLACTELPLVFDEVRTGTPLVSTIELQCREAVRFSLAD